MAGTSRYDEQIKNDKMQQILRWLVNSAGGVPEFAQALGIERLIVHETLNRKRRVNEDIILRGVQVFCRRTES